MDDHCPLCDGVLVLLGVLGGLRYFRCRQCGAELREEIEL